MKTVKIRKTTRTHFLFLICSISDGIFGDEIWGKGIPDGPEVKGGGHGTRGGTLTTGRILGIKNGGGGGPPATDSGAATMCDGKTGGPAATGNGTAAMNGGTTCGPAATMTGGPTATCDGLATGSGAAVMEVGPTETSGGPEATSGGTEFIDCGPPKTGGRGLAVNIGGVRIDESGKLTTDNDGTGGGAAGNRGGLTAKGDEFSVSGGRTAIAGAK